MKIKATIVVFPVIQKLLTNFHMLALYGPESYGCSFSEKNGILNELVKVKLPIIVY